MLYYDRPYKNPHPTDMSAGHWEGAKRGKLVLLRCQDCGQYVHFPSKICDRCMSENLDWAELSGRGKVESYTVVYRPFSPEFEADVPYTAAVVRLDEGPMLLTWLYGVEPEKAKVGMPVEVTFEKMSDEISLHRFRPVAET